MAINPLQQEKGKFIKRESAPNTPSARESSKKASDSNFKIQASLLPFDRIVETNEISRLSEYKNGEQMIKGDSSQLKPSSPVDDLTEEGESK